MNYKELKAKDANLSQSTTALSSTSLIDKLMLIISNSDKRKALKLRIINKIHHIYETNFLRLYANLELTRKLDYSQQTIYLNVTSLDEHKRLRSCKKEPWTVAWIEKYIQPGDVLFDIGANVGVYSLIAAKHTHKKVKIFAFEPAFANFSSLCKNIILNDCQDCITPFQIALSNETGLAEFNYSTIAPGAALHTLGKPIYFTGEQFNSAYKQSVLSYRLDRFIEEFNLPVPNHLKLDVDGPELEVLHGAEKVLSNLKLRSLMVELNEDANKSDEIIVDLLESKGFKLYTRHIRVNPQGIRQPYSFCVFLRGESS